MSIMFLNDVGEQPVARSASVSVNVGLYVVAALISVVVAPLVLSYLMGGVAPMLILTVYLLPLVPLLLLVAGGALAFSVVGPILKASITQHA